jgi:hypothetical protein
MGFSERGQPPPAHAVLAHYAWRHHCRGLFPDADRGVICEFAMDRHGLDIKRV